VALGSAENSSEPALAGPASDDYLKAMDDKDDAETAGEMLEFPVEREPSFARFTADQAIAFDLGRDMEFAFIQFGPKIVAKKRSSEGNSVKEAFALTSSLTEVARVRISPEGASTFAMSIIDRIAKSGELDFDALRENIEKIIASAPEDATSEDA
jgi:hypothetical protein